MTTAETHTRTITVERIEPIRSGTAKSGRPWTLYTVHGKYPDSSPLVNVKTFDALAVGDVPVTLERERKGDGWIARSRVIDKPKRARKRDDDDAITRLESRVERLEKQMRAIIENAEVSLP